MFNMGLFLQYRAVKEKVGLLTLSDRGKIEVSGRDAKSFIHNLVTNEIKALSSHHLCYTLMLDHKGKILADAYIWAEPNCLLIETELFLKSRVLERLHTFLVTEEVVIQDRTQEYQLIALEGPQSSLLLEHLGSLQSKGVFIGERSLTGTKGYSLMIPYSVWESVREVVTKQGELLGLVSVGPVIQECLRIEAGIPRYGNDFSQENFLQETGLVHAVSYTKGCYIGQEIVARMKTYGGIRRRLVGIKILEDRPFDENKVGAYRDLPLLADKGENVGRITSSVFSPQWGRMIGLGYVQRDAIREGRLLQIEQNNRRIPVEMITLPGLPLEDSSVQKKC